MAELTYPRPGDPGASAHAVYQRRLSAEWRRHQSALAEEARRREEWRRAHPVLGRLTARRSRPSAFGVSSGTEAWAVGAAGERVVGAALESCPEVSVLHDRALPGCRANLDHLAVGPAGLYVVETKAYAAPVEVRDAGRWLRPDWRLMVAGRDRSDLLSAVRGQAEAVARVLHRVLPGSGLDVAPVICFVGADWHLPDRPVWVGDAALAEPHRLAEVVGRRGRMSPDAAACVAGIMGRALPPR